MWKIAKEVVLWVAVVLVLLLVVPWVLVGMAGCALSDWLGEHR